jgi:outer membrane protein, heavy metal efflux system
MAAIHRSNFLAVVLLGGLSTAAAAQGQGSQSSGVVEIRLTEVVDQALLRNRDLLVKRREIDVARGRLEQARRYPFNPELNLQGDVGQGSGRVEPGDRRIGGGTVSLTQVVEVRGQRGLRIQAAEADVATAEWAARDGERELRGATTRAFTDLLVAQERVGLARQSLDLVTSFKSTAEELFRAGEVPEVDVLRAEVEVRRAVNRLAQDEASLTGIIRALALLIGSAPDTKLRAQGPLLLEPIPGGVEDLRALARSGRFDLRAVGAAADRARAALRLVEAERFLPSITLSAGYAETNDFDALNRRVIFGVSIPLPLWNRRDGDLRAGAGDVSRLQAQYDQLAAQIDKEVLTAHQQFLTAQRVVEEYVRRIVPSQERAAEMVREGYRLGQFRLTDALLSQRDLIDTRTGYLDAITAYNVARAELQKAVGLTQ